MPNTMQALRTYEFKINSSVPFGGTVIIPPIVDDSNINARTKNKKSRQNVGLRAALASLTEGESILIPDKFISPNTLSALKSQNIRELKICVCYKKTDGGIRLWRISLNQAQALIKAGALAHDRTRWKRRKNDQVKVKGQLPAGAGGRPSSLAGVPSDWIKEYPTWAEQAAVKSSELMAKECLYADSQDVTTDAAARADGFRLGVSYAIGVMREVLNKINV